MVEGHTQKTPKYNYPTSLPYDPTVQVPCRMMFAIAGAFGPGAKKEFRQVLSCRLYALLCTVPDCFSTALDRTFFKIEKKPPRNICINSFQHEGWMLLKLFYRNNKFCLRSGSSDASLPQAIPRNHQTTLPVPFSLL